MTYHVIKAFDLIEISQITLGLLLSADSSASGNSIKHNPLPLLMLAFCLGGLWKGACYCLSLLRAVCLGSKMPFVFRLLSFFPVMPELEWNNPADSNELFEICIDVRTAEFFLC